MGGNSTYDAVLKGIPEIARTHFALSQRIDGHKILLQKKNSNRVQLPMNSNSESPLYLCAHTKKNGTVEVTSIGIYENHKCVAQIDLEFDKDGNYKPYVKGNKKTSHFHYFNIDPNTGGVGRKSHDRHNTHPIDETLTPLIQKIVFFNKQKHKL